MQRIMLAAAVLAFGGAAIAADCQSPKNLSLSDTMNCAAQRALPTVVTVKVTGDQERTRKDGQEVLYYDVVSGGSGVIFDKENGLVVTNRHIVEDFDPYDTENTEIKVTVHNATTKDYGAKLCGYDDHPDSLDIAILKITDPFEDLTQASMMTDRTSLGIGHLVLAIGSPLGFDQTVTTGIISSLGRRLWGPKEGSSGLYLQTDAAINSGSSGGALINLDGQLVGLNTLRVKANRGSGIGFAIPIDVVQAGIKLLKAYGRIPPNTLGITKGEMTEDGYMVNSTKNENGKVRAGDVIKEIGDSKVKSEVDLALQLAGFARDDETYLTIKREDSDVTVPIRISEHLPEPLMDGATYVDEEDGVKILRIWRGPFHSKLRQGDIITRIGNNKIDNTPQWEAALRGLHDKPEVTVTVHVRRDGKPLAQRVRIETGADSDYCG